MKKLLNRIRTRITGWKSYFFQFISIFLAVYLGFVADNYRDVRLQRQAERQYIISLINDVEADNRNTEVVIEDFETRAKGMDTLLRSFRQSVNANAETYFQTSQYFKGWEDYYPVTGTMDQLRSGGFRLIRSQRAIDSITAYYGKTDDIVGETDNLRRHFHNTWDAMTELIDQYMIDSLVAEKQFSFKQQPLRNLFLTNDRTALNKFYLGLHIVRGTLRYIENGHKAHVAQGERLIATLKNEYDLDE